MSVGVGPHPVDGSEWRSFSLVAGVQTQVDEVLILSTTNQIFMYCGTEYSVHQNQ